MINTTTLVSIALLLLGISMLLFPPKFGNSIFGISNQATTRDEESWKLGQRLYAYALLIMGVIIEIAGLILEISEAKYKSLISLGLLIGLWLIAKIIINNRLGAK